MAFLFLITQNGDMFINVMHNRYDYKIVLQSKSLKNLKSLNNNTPTTNVLFGKIRL